ncbi:acyl protein thioesterase family [Anaeramoeba flamelloides]|uniref:Acyl protein thioesterase family n=1 Tax=Anaeramoeba flamelloides TaxID=1746091 RepID=A0AAV7ZMQ1_9EUKA|nr:acyl protein thioesterase family [Anaeramoeba flamelloides]
MYNFYRVFISFLVLLSLIENTKINQPIIIEPTKAHQSTIFLLHGLGDNGRSYVNVARSLQKSFPNSRFILPTAPRIPVTVNLGMLMNAWYDIKKISPDSNENTEFLEEITESLLEYVEKEANNFPQNVDPKIVLAGFSQGAAISFFSAMRRTDIKIAGVVMMSGYLLKPKNIEKEIRQVNKKTPIFMGHGTSDQVILYNWSQQSYKIMIELGLNVEYHSYTKMQHSISKQVISDVKDFLLMVLSER